MFYAELLQPTHVKIVCISTPGGVPCRWESAVVPIVDEALAFNEWDQHVIATREDIIDADGQKRGTASHMSNRLSIIQGE